jgi:ribonuclease E
MSRECFVTVERTRIRVRTVVDSVEIADRTDPLTPLGMHGNIYYGRIAHIDPENQAAILDLGPCRGWLHVRDVIPQHYGHAPCTSNPQLASAKPPIELIYEPGQFVIVQAAGDSKEKTCFLTTYLALAGKFLVMMPSLDRCGVARKIEDPAERQRLRELCDQLGLPELFSGGFIVRQTAAGRTLEDLQRDATYLTALWQRCLDRCKQSDAPCLLFEELSGPAWYVRDALLDGMDTVWLDDPQTLAVVRAGLGPLLPELIGRVRLREGSNKTRR